MPAVNVLAVQNFNVNKKFSQFKNYSDLPAPNIVGDCTYYSFKILVATP
jgi:hypothetical protein